MTMLSIKSFPLNSKSSAYIYPVKNCLRFLIPLVVIALVAFSFYCFSIMQVKDTPPPTAQQNMVEEEDCPPEGMTHAANLQELNRLKNRAVFPEETDFDKTLTLQKMLEPGNDRDRWSTGKAAEVTGYVADVKVGGVETCNCKAKDPDHRDTHIELVLNAMNFTNAQKVIVEVTPRMRNIMQAKGEDWSTRAMRDKFLGRWVKVKGWLLFDSEHAHQAENTNPGNERNWRATSWEIHPIVSIETVNRLR